MTSGLIPRFLVSRFQSPTSLTQRRFYLVEYVYTTKDGQLEDPLRAALRLQRTEDSEGFQERYGKYQYFEKPTKRRQREESEQKYRHKKNEVMAIKRWIEEREINTEKKGDYGDST